MNNYLSMLSNSYCASVVIRTVNLKSMYGNLIINIDHHAFNYYFWNNEKLIYN
jgi:hypothetical protein